MMTEMSTKSVHEKRAVTQKADRRDFGQDYEAASISHQDNEQCKSDDVREEQ
jgi:hypothetical protein